MRGVVQGCFNVLSFPIRIYDVQKLISGRLLNISKPQNVSCRNTHKINFSPLKICFVAFMSILIQMFPRSNAGDFQTLKTVVCSCSILNSFSASIAVISYSVWFLMCSLKLFATNAYMKQWGALSPPA